jgi:mono/diheme cytochrome c family protein
MEYQRLLSKYFLFSLCTLSVWAQTPNWDKGFEVRTPRENLYNLPVESFESTIMKGRRHALFYPVTVTNLRIPYYPLMTFFEKESNDPVKRLLFELTRTISPFKNMNEVFKWLGLHEFPTEVQQETPNPLPALTKEEKTLPMGATLMHDRSGTGITFACATCHSADLFGVKVLGLTNRFPRANDFFRKGAQLAPYVNSFIFKEMLDTTENERLMVIKAKKHLKFVGAKTPVSIGLDTSLAQVALSLAKREQDEYASMTTYSQKNPRPNILETMVADSKPAVWWNLKYKNRWLSDGSIVSGNPVHTNFLWNEIGRGADLKELEKWLEKNKETINDLTAAVFASKPPRYEKFFGVDSVDLEKAKRGQKHFIQSCQSCHGSYKKGWDLENAADLTKAELIQNVKVTYHSQTPVIDVGTDPGRYLGMKGFANDLNRLRISKSINAVVQPQKGYVPPPLDGVWSRWPYFHNNSAPNLCTVLTPGPKRPVTYWAGPANDKKLDFDDTCVGYPLGTRVPTQWKKNPEFLFDTRKKGLSNQGHDDRIFIKDGVEIFNTENKLELIEFLKTL